MMDDYDRHYNNCATCQRADRCPQGEGLWLEKLARLEGEDEIQDLNPEPRPNGLELERILKEAQDYRDSPRLIKAIRHLAAHPYSGQLSGPEDPVGWELGLAAKEAEE